MADTLSPAQRSERMARIRGQHTKPELHVRRRLHGVCPITRCRARRVETGGRNSSWGS
ncbi:hypothetical protein H1235_12665 [Pseudoxanthomonas sp. NC8]|nr:hypothetical protein H1235_12665 [Pseudoxanthomonas sp. NC8]